MSKQLFDYTIDDGDDGINIQVELEFGVHDVTGSTTLVLVTPENTPYDETYEIYASVEIPRAPMPGPDFLIIKDWGDEPEIRKQLIKMEIIEDRVYGTAPSGYIIASISKLTPKAIAIRDAQLA